ncbi:MAG: PDZ domain-containing protein [Ardenticatenales bacterium]|nr:PDZ domain-containing protein [Ardenticatenales bacterium]
MTKKLVTIGLVLTAVLAVGIGLAFRSVVSAVSGSQPGRSALAQLERALNADEVDAQPSTGASPADPNADPDTVTGVVVTSAVAAARIDEGPGVLVTGLVKDGAAAKAGIARGDIILGIDGKDIQRFADLTKALKGKAAGDTVQLKVQHGDDVRDRDVTLQSGGGAAQLGIASCGGGMAPRIAIRHAIGGGPAVVDTVTADSPAAKAGLKEGDRITAVDGEKLTGGTIAFAHGSMHSGPSHGMGFLRRLFGHDETQADPSTAPSADDPATADGAEGGPDQVPGVAALPAEPSADAVPLGEAERGLTLADAIARHKPGDTVKLTVEHDGEAAREVSVVLGAHPDDAAKAFLGVTYGHTMDTMAMPEAMMQVMPFSGDAMGAVPAMPPFGGMHDDPAMRELFEQLGDDVGGIVVGDVTADSAAAKAGVQAKDVITKLDGRAVDGPEALATAIGAKKPGETVTLTVVRPNAEPTDITVTLGANPDDASKGFLGLSMTGFFLRHIGPAGSGPDGAGDNTMFEWKVAPSMPAQPATEPFETRIDAPPSSDA